MTVLSYRDRASFETAKRLLAEVVNEGLVGATLKFPGAIENQQQRLVLHKYRTPLAKSQKWVEVGVQRGSYIGMQSDKVVSLVRAESLQPPVIIGDGAVERGELDPEALLGFMIPWLVDEAEASEALLMKVGKELKNSSINQGWYSWTKGSLDVY
jgi:hypothetical protein